MASVVEVWRYPVKSMAGERMDSCAVTENGLEGDRRWALVDGNGNHESFDQKVGDVVFAPQGSFHYFENLGPDEMKIVIVQNTSAPEAKDNIGIGESISQLCNP